jgi:hypothetical protein
VHPSPRIINRVARDYPGRRTAEVVQLLSELDLPVGGRPEQPDERIYAAILIRADGDINALLAAAALAEHDWRDVLVAAGLADEGWRDEVERYLAAAGN